MDIKVIGVNELSSTKFECQLSNNTTLIIHLEDGEVFGETTYKENFLIFEQLYDKCIEYLVFNSFIEYDVPTDSWV